MTTTTNNNTSAVQNSRPCAAQLKHGLQIAAGILLAALTVSHVSQSIGEGTIQGASLGQVVFEAQPATPIAFDPTELAARAEEAIVMVGAVDHRGGYSQIGTGFVILDGADQGVVATNAHVAGGLNEAVANGLQPIVRKPTVGAPEDFEIIGAPEIHPGYQRWARIADQGMLRRSAGGLASYRLVAPADVAVVRIRPGIGASLKIATRSEAMSVQAGSSVLYMGFPGESMVGPRENTPPMTGVGTIAAMSGVALEPTTEEESLIIHHTVLCTGGSSGGPIIVADPSTGEPMVVAIHSAANHVFLEGGRVPVSNSYAQRIDFLQEMLDGDADRAQNARDQRWSDVIMGPAISVEERLGSLSDAVDPDRRMRRTAERVVELRASAENPNAQHVFQMNVQAGRTYAVIATSDDWSDIDLVVNSQGQTMAEDRAPDAYPVLRWTARADGVVTISLVAADPTTIPSQVEIWVLESEPTHARYTKARGG